MCNFGCNFHDGNICPPGNSNLAYGGCLNSCHASFRKNNRVHWTEVLWKRLIESEGLRYSDNMTAFYSNMTGNGFKGCAYPKSWPFLSHFGSIIWRNRWEVLCRPMVSAGENHTVLLRSDGIAVACGANHDGQCNFPRLDDGMMYTKVSAGSYHSILLRSDGIAVACGMNNHGQCNIPCLEDGMTYTQVSAGGSHTVLLRSDGIAVACGNPAHGRNIPSLDDTMTYTQVSAGQSHTVLLRSDGIAVACGENTHGQCNIPCLEDGMTYTQVSAGDFHTVLLRSDGVAVACGLSTHGACHFPRVEDGMRYTQVSAGANFTVLLRSDGIAVARGLNVQGQCNIPRLDDGMTYTQVLTGRFHSVLLRSDGGAVACGMNNHGQCKMVTPDPGTWYVADAELCGDIVVQLDFACQDDAMLLTCSDLTGEAVVCLSTAPRELAWGIHKRLARELKLPLQRLRVVLPDGLLLASVCRANPGASLGDVAGVGSEKSRPWWWPTNNHFKVGHGVCKFLPGIPGYTALHDFLGGYPMIQTPWWTYLDVKGA